MKNESTDQAENLDHLDPLVAVIVKKRKERKLTQETVAAAAGISRRALVMIEGGGDCTLSTLRRLYSTLDIELETNAPQRPTLEDMDSQNSRELFGRQRG